MQGNNYGLLMKTIKKFPKSLFGQPDGFSLLTSTKFAVRFAFAELPFTLQHDREFVMFMCHFPLFIKLFMLLLCVIFTRGVLSIPACDVYVRLKTNGAAIKIAIWTTNNQ